MSDSFWKSRRVLITGHTGFKGSWLSFWLQRLQATVAGYALVPPTQPNLFEAAAIEDGMTSLRGDVRNAEKLRGFIAEFEADVIIHMAAQSLIRRSYADPVTTYATNVMGTVNVLDAARLSDCVRVILNVTSDKCYENREWLWGYRESEPMGGYDPYSSSKACAELVTAAFRRSFLVGYSAFRRPEPLALASARAGNVIGGGDWAEDRLVPDIMQAFLAGHVPLIRNPHSVRPWQHVLDPLGGYLKLVERLYEDDGLRYAEAWNFGPREDGAKSVAWMADRLADLWGPPARWDEASAGAQPHEAHFLKLDCSKADARLGWRPRLTLEETLTWTVDWYKCFQRCGDLRGIMDEQIAKYEQRAA